MTHRQSKDTSRGFTLIQLSILLTVAALVLVTVLPSAQVTLNSNIGTANSLGSVWLALREYESANGVLPCPADASQPIGSSSYGLAAANAGTASNCSGSAPAANYVDSTNHIAIGMVPVKTLQLPAGAALDAFGRDITYAVDTHATSCWGTNYLPGQITVTDNGVNGYTVATLVSHGADGHGAWLPLTGNSGSATRLNAGIGATTDPDQLTNAHITSSFTPTTPLTNFVKKPPTGIFDDLLVYNSSRWSMNKLPAAYSTMLTPTVSTPAFGTYLAGQTLAFTLTFSQPVTVVSGTPRLDLTAIGSYTSIGGGSIGYANYSSGSGTTSLVFVYNVLNSDIAPNGIILASSIDMNGAVMTPCPMPFTPPSLSGVILGECYYITDKQNYNVRKVAATGIITALAGTGSSGNGPYGGAATAAALGLPYTSAVDSYGNIYIASSADNTVLKVAFATGKITQFAGTGTVGNTGNGGAATSATLSNPKGVAVDSSNNVYIADTGNSAVRMVSAATGNISTFAGTGIPGYSGDTGAATSALLTSPTDIAFDSAGNAYIADNGNNTVRKVTAGTGIINTVAGNGIYAAPTLGGAATSSSLMNPYGVAVDSIGNIYIADRDTHQVLKVSTAGILTAFAGNGIQGYSGNNGIASNAELYHPDGVNVDKLNNVFIADSGNGVVREVYAATGNITLIAGTPDVYANSGNNGAATSAHMQYPTGVVVTSACR